MNMDIFNKYKEIDISIINSIKNDQEDLELFEKREKIIKEMLLIKKSKEKMKKRYDEMGLRELDKKVEELLKEKIIDTKNEINKLSKRRIASRGYANANRRMNFFSTNV